MRRIFLFILLLAVIGCQRTPISGLVAAQGKVFFDGLAVGEVDIVFTPTQGSASDRFATAVSDASGSFTLETAGYRGALPGRYVVTLSKKTITSKISPEEEEKLSTAGKPIPQPEIVYHIPWKYENASESGIFIEIDKNGKTDISIELQPDNTPIPPQKY
jgi:hypothetical protein